MKQIEISGPWGEYKGDDDNYPGLIRYYITKLEYYIVHKMSLNPSRTMSNIEGYYELLKTDNRETMRLFFGIKSSGVRGNKNVIAIMKKNNEWDKK